jgi:pyridoxal phosphate enzyme (YggS family)
VAAVISPDLVAANLADVRTRIGAAGGDATAITVVAVTKDQPREAIPAAIDAGLVELGENRADALVDAATAHPQARWHFLAPVQRNKVARLAPHVALWQSVDRPAAGEAIAARAPGAAVLVQVNLTDDAGRGGCALRDAAPLAKSLAAAGLDVRGLMAVGPLGAPEMARPGFAAVRRLADELGFPVRSFGMSNDLEVAVQEGTTMVRVGTALFGPRPSANRARH